MNRPQPQPDLLDLPDLLDQTYLTYLTYLTCFNMEPTLPRAGPAGIIGFRAGWSASGQVGSGEVLVQVVWCCF